MKRKIIKKEMTLAEMKQKRAEIEDFKSEKFHRHSEQEFIRAIKLSDGYQTRVAKLLGITCGAVSQRIKKSEKLQECLDEILQECLDATEFQLMKARDEGQPYAIQFILRSKGRQRGWGERIDVDATLRPVGGVLQVPYQFESSKAWEEVAIKHQKQLMQKVDNEFRNDEGNDVEEQDSEEEEQKFIQQSYNFED